MKGFTNLALSFAREVTIGNEFQVALVACHMIGNVHFTALIYPELSHDYVMHRRRDLAPSKMVACQYKKKKIRETFALQTIFPVYHTTFSYIKRIKISNSPESLNSK